MGAGDLSYYSLEACEPVVHEVLLLPLLLNHVIHRSLDGVSRILHLASRALYLLDADQRHVLSHDYSF